jgi:hypothetical protein
MLRHRGRKQLDLVQEHHKAALINVPIEAGLAEIIEKECALKARWQGRELLRTNSL